MYNKILQTQPLRIVFFGTTEFSMYHLYALINAEAYQIIAIFTKPTKLNNTLSLSIKSLIKKHNILLFKSVNITTSEIKNIIKKLNVDLIIVVSYGLIFTKEILNIPKLGCINVHGSLLPKWRGPAPIQRALEHGDSITGISIIKMDTGIDTGHILKSVYCKILSHDTSYTLLKKLAYIGSITLLKELKNIELGTYKITIQNSLYATYAHKIKKQEGRINWRLSANQIERRIRAFNPWPSAFFLTKKNVTVKVWEAIINHHTKKNINIKSYILPGTILKTNLHGIHVCTGKGILILTSLQIPGKKIITSNDILNARREWFTPYSILK